MAVTHWVYRRMRAMLILPALLAAPVLHAQEGRADAAVSPLEDGAAEQKLSDAAREVGYTQSREQGAEEDAFSQKLGVAQLVARVKITGVHRMIDQALSEPGMVAILGYVYSGVAEKVWKGEPAKLIAFRLTLDHCDRKLKRGEHYVIFAETDRDGRLQLSSCEAAVTEADAPNLLVKLNQYYQG
ncbi:hypothetical protein M0G74_06895 [Microbulbifer sp. CAU 1566]|uniref:hypothetical protein n=1 Tax=Microbulbifer sp. CAU 1566 TaxID=2933269 RepID=UPI002003C106|nr:hypothetical protein [Microbulbifer sp. CAU 1566]MCK7596999.1 hypothetical protein [Microbulbifer sp. CAU 1566]